MLLVGLGGGYAALMLQLRKGSIARQQQLVEAAFEVQVCKHPSLATATLVRKQDEISGENAVSVQTHRIYRGADGSYWLFICTSSQAGYLTQLNEERAKNALRSTPEILAKEFPGEA